MRKYKRHVSIAAGAILWTALTLTLALEAVKAAVYGDGPAVIGCIQACLFFLPIITGLSIGLGVLVSFAVDDLTKGQS